MPENPRTPMPHDPSRPFETVDEASDRARAMAAELLQTLPRTATDWPLAQRRQLGVRLSELSGTLRKLGAAQPIWQTVLELATSLGRLSPNGAFPPPPRGPLLQRIQTVLHQLTQSQGSLTAQPPPPPREGPDIPYTRMLLRRLDSQ